jgi:erythromycin esterase
MQNDRMINLTAVGPCAGASELMELLYVLAFGAHWVWRERRVRSLANNHVQGKGPTPMQEIQNNWMREKATDFVSCDPDSPLTDGERAAVDGIVGKARVVAIGEATHGSRAIIQSSQRVLRYLIQERKADIVVFEADFGATQTLNRFVMEGSVDAEEALAAAGGWNYANHEMLGFVKWLRDYNCTPQGANRPVRVFGCDVQSFDGAKTELMHLLRGFAGLATSLQGDVSETVALVSELPADRDLALIYELIDEIVKVKTANEGQIAELMARQSELAATARESFGKLSSRLRRMQLPGTLSDDDRFMFERCQRALEQAIEFWSSGGAEKRDLLMAENVIALWRHFQPDRLLLLAHNLHVARAPCSLRGYDLRSMGCHLSQQLGSNYRAIGSAFYAGRYLALAEYRAEDDLIETARTPGPLAFESLLQRVVQDRQTPGVLVDLSESADQRGEFPWQDDIEMRIGETGPQGTYEHCFVRQRPERHYDGMMFLQVTSPITVLSGYYHHATKQWKPSDRGGNP